MPAKAGGPSGGKSEGKDQKANTTTPKVKTAKKGEGKGKKRAVRTGSLCIFKVQVHSDTSISSNKGMNIVKSFINDLFDCLLPRLVCVCHCLAPCNHPGQFRGGTVGLRWGVVIFLRPADPHLAGRLVGFSKWTRMNGKDT